MTPLPINFMVTLPDTDDLADFSGNGSVNEDLGPFDSLCKPQRPVQVPDELET
jgi:hypothetical protein